MGLIVDKGWHKFALLILMCFFSFLFTMVFLPMVWVFFETPTGEFFFNSFVLFFLGGIVFNIIFTISYHAEKPELDKGLPIGFVLRVFCHKLILYAFLICVMASLTGNILLYVYMFLFLMFGGYAWYCVLRGYVKARIDYENNVEKGKLISWLEILLCIGIVLSLLIGYFHRFVGI